MDPAVSRGVAEEDLLRAQFYGLLAHLLVAPPDATGLDQLAALQGDETPLGQGLRALAETAAAATAQAVEEEYTALFIGLTRGELVPYASYYLTGFLNEKPLALLRGRLARLGIEREPATKEPEDHIGFLCEVMHGLLAGLYPAGTGVAAQRAFFEAHIAPWADAFFSDLKAAPSARFYRPVADIGRVFLDIEREVFAMRQDADAPPA